MSPSRRTTSLTIRCKSFAISSRPGVCEPKGGIRRCKAKKHESNLLRRGFLFHDNTSVLFPLSQRMVLQHHVKLGMAHLVATTAYDDRMLELYCNFRVVYVCAIRNVLFEGVRQIRQDVLHVCIIFRPAASIPKVLMSECPFDLSCTCVLKIAVAQDVSPAHGTVFCLDQL